MKNKVAPPFRQAEFDLMFGEGVSKEGCILDMGVDCGIVDKSGNWFAYKEEKIGQGREAAKETLRNNSKIRNEIEKSVREAYGFLPAKSTKTVEKKKETDTSKGTKSTSQKK